MTEIDAIGLIQNMVRNGNLNQFAVKALNLAIFALDRTIPRKPARHSQDTSDWDCPHCSYEFLTDEKHCPNCGSAIDWKESNK